MAEARGWYALALLCALLGQGGAPPEDGWRAVEPGLALEYPRDHGSHPAYRTEWWYLTGELADEASGERFGFQLTLFRSGMDPRPLEADQSPLRLRHVFAGHLALTEIARGRARFAERLRRGGTPLAFASERDLEVRVEDWTLARGADDELALRAGDPAQGFALELELAPRKALVLHGERGYSRKGGGAGNASAYASWTRLAASGTLARDGRELAVRGEAWFDHEFGSSVLPEGVVGWDWLALRLDGNAELMLFRLRRADGTLDPASAGTWVAPDGSARPLRSSDFELRATTTWTSPRSRGVYPAGWTLRVPSEGLDVALFPEEADCEWNTAASTGVTYWEGPLRVSGSRAGSGYAELTGYAGSMGGRF